ncbi:Arylsulfatase precursor [Polystyrenella longa]|uniref:Arylsulfatase n=1 Tax=Polystyrenella longa TaxID=2528007 RepID=A0A518CPW3_9PLAN|nr:sulfatase-like hydrolase/transferase [Polystyrenella longa]QDU81270.1 Arylsulfatase precursor [Polystyrenella longa]
MAFFSKQAFGLVVLGLLSGQFFTQASLVLAAEPETAATAWGGSPNIVLILSDDQAWTDFSFMGHPDIDTPNLDALSEESFLYPDGYVTTSLCRPSLATLISGYYPHQHGITGNDPPKGTDRNLMLKHIDRIPKLPAMLAEKGYVSFQSGKWWEGAPSRGGFTAGMTHGDTSRGGRHGDEGLKVGRQGMAPVFNFIDSHAGNPFYLWYAPFLPHTPHTPPQRLLDKYTQEGRPIQLAKYYAMCEWFDETCGELVDGLTERGMRENTLIVFVTDNGWIQKTPESKIPPGWRQPFAPRSKRSPNDGGLRTPIFFNWPGVIKPGISETPVTALDVVPTMLAAAGLEKTEAMPGVNLFPEGTPRTDLDDRPLFGEIFEHDLVDIDAPSTSLLYRWVRSDDWKLILPEAENEPVQLYQLADDPHENHNLAAKYPELVVKLTSQINNWWDGRTDNLQ